MQRGAAEKIGGFMNTPPPDGHLNRPSQTP